MKKNFVFALLAGALSLTATSAFGQAGTGNSVDVVKGFVSEAIKHVNEALAQAQAGNAPGTAEHARAASAQADEAAVTENAGMDIEQAQNRLTTAIKASDKGDATAAVAPLQESLTLLTGALGKL
ncbi:MAG: small metal-binding protein SmbP [Gammaproteobacteria bacterium]